MNSFSNTLESLIEWVMTTRHTSEQLDHLADNLLVNLQYISSRACRIAKQHNQSPTLGIYGHDQAGKNRLLAALLHQSGQHIKVILGDKTLDYLTHINPLNVPPLIAVRFTHKSTVELPQYPLQLALFNERELVSQFVARYQQGNRQRILTNHYISQRLTQLATRCQPNKVGPNNQADIALLLAEYRHLQRRRFCLSQTLEVRFMMLAPRLSLVDRAELFSLLWGEDNELTLEWLQLAQWLEQLGNPEHVLAPASLVMDNFIVPTEPLMMPLTSSEPHKDRGVHICPLINGTVLPPLCISQQDLIKICAEIILRRKSAEALANVDLLDIPLHQLDFYTQRLQPDILLLCNTVKKVSEIASADATLTRWVDCTQSAEADVSPGLIWMNTAAGLRWETAAQWDDRVQQRLRSSGTQWQRLQVLGQRNMHLLRNQIQTIATSERQAYRLANLRTTLEDRVKQLFYCFTDIYSRSLDHHATQSENIVRALQTHIIQLGSLLANLVPSREALNQCWLETYQQPLPNCNSQRLLVDLFANEEANEITPTENFAYSKSVYRCWINHLYARLQQEKVCPTLFLSPPQWHNLCNMLITISYHLELPALLDNIGCGLNQDLVVARSHSALGDFVAWLGYANTPTDNRPLSRVNKQRPIFSADNIPDINQPLSKLSEQIQYANTNYTYDWLLALYTRTSETCGFQNPQVISTCQQQNLSNLLTQLR